MHLYRFSVNQIQPGLRRGDSWLRECYRSMGRSEIEELLIIRQNTYLEIFAVGNDPELISRTVANFIEKKTKISPIKIEDIFEGQKALKCFFDYLLSNSAGIPLDPKHLLHIKEEFNIALDEDAIGPIITNIYRRGENFENELQSDPLINKNCISYPEVLLDIARKISGPMDDFQFIIIGDQNRNLENIFSSIKRVGNKKISFYHPDFSIAYKQSFNLGGIPLDYQQLQTNLTRNTVIINCDNSTSGLFDLISPIAKMNRNISYLYFDLSKGDTDKPKSNLPNLFIQTDKEIKRLITLHTNNRKNYLATLNKRIETEISYFYEWLYSDERFIFENIVSGNRRMQRVFELMRRIAPSGISVLITGETGTGKELIARAIHHNSHRANNRFVAVNCSAIPDTLLESELFGYQKGAFTGAIVSKKGLIELASGGTLFLDEIGDLAPIIQVKLLRVLQEREILRLGDTTPIKVDIRLVTATNHDLEELNFIGKFRSDLFYRVNTVQISLPPLRQRGEDVPLLTNYFIDKLNQESGKHIAKISDEVLNIFRLYDWPGNIRELENVIDRAFAVSIGEEITLTDLPARLQTFKRKRITTPPDPDEIQGTLKQFEAERIKDLLIKKQLNMSEVAQILGIGRTTLWRKMKEYRIYRENHEGKIDI